MLFNFFLNGPHSVRLVIDLHIGHYAWRARADADKLAFLHNFHELVVIALNCGFKRADIGVKAA